MVKFDPKVHSLSMVSCTLESFPKGAVDSLILVCSSGIIRTYLTVQGTLLPMARNATIAAVYENNPKFTHLILIDSDMMNFGPQHIIKLIEDDKPIVSALVVQRQPPFKLVIHSFKSDQELYNAIQKKEIVESVNVGMAFTVIKREVLEAMREETDAGPIWFTTDREEREGFQTEVDKFKLDVKSLTKEFGIKDNNVNDIIDKAVAMGQLSHKGTELIGEDIEFCRRARKMGIISWVDCGVQVGHIANFAAGPEDAMQDEPVIKKPELKLVGVD